MGNQTIEKQAPAIVRLIERNEINALETLIKSHPEILSIPLTKQSGLTCLHYSAYTGKLVFVRLFVQQFKVDVNIETKVKRETPIMQALARNHIEIIQYLLDKGARCDIRSSIGLNALQYAVLYGLYQVALQMQEIIKKQSGPEAVVYQDAETYKQLAKTYKIRFVDYVEVLKGLQKEMDPMSLENYLKQPKVVYNDPVVDPRESWKQWVGRQLQFQDPPLVERSELPQELQPQNRKYGAVRHFFTRMSISGLTQKPNFQPENQSEFHESGQQFKELAPGRKLRRDIDAQTIS